jgi:hypothetical protein
MDTDRDPHRGQVPLPGFGESAPTADQNDRGGPARGEGVRHVRRMSNWTAAALIVGTGATTVALAHHAFPVTAPAASTVTGTTGAAGAATTALGTGGPQVSHAVATTSGSGVVVTTTTHAANGKVIVTHVKHSTYQDN